jgi:ribonuclease P protein component
LTERLEISKEIRSDTFQGADYEKDIPAEPDQAQKNARLSRAHEHPERQSRPPAQARQGTEKISGVAFDSGHRLRRRADFLLCYNAGRRHYAKQFVLFARNRKDGGLWRLGLAVTRKTGGAVVRNRVKRVVREFFRLNQKRLPQGYDIVVVPMRTLNPSDLSLAVAGREFLPLLAALAR